MKSFIPEKPTDVTWTDDQWKAIWAKDQDILVAAAAGSGKTAVLVERIIQKILSADDPIDVDELLVVTFTDASAAEMRNRVGEALEKAISANPKSKHLRKQLSLLNRASISTLHSFCLQVVKKYYYKIDIDPSFRIADTTESLLLRDEVLDELLEEEYGKDNNEPFYALVDTFTKDRTDDALKDMIGEIYDFATSNPSFQNYLNKIVSMYEIEDGATIDDLPFTKILLNDIEIQLNGAKQLFESALNLTKLPAGPSPRAETFLEDIQITDVLLQAKKDGWNTLYEAMQSYSFPRLKPVRGDEYDKELAEKSKDLRDKGKKIIDKIKGELFSRRPESFLKDMNEMAPHIHVLADLVKKFADNFERAKLEKGIVDFSDLEHYCLRILGKEDEEGNFHPTEVAHYYRNKFKEVLVDEYQDTNMVQEAILKLVAREGEKDGNMFMVGDVKQSIYRFRLAEPNLFLGKYNRFTKDGADSGLRIDLSRNFRSRKEVLDGTNYIFQQLMDEKIGEVEYDEEARLVKGAPYPEEEAYPVELVLIEAEGEEEPASEESEETVFADLEEARLEAKLMARKIKELVEERTEVYDPKRKKYRPLKYRDIVILHRALKWAPELMEEFKEEGIPLYTDLSTGYFEATEVSIMLSLLKVIDNPFQDIPLAAVLRSPIVGLNEEQLSFIRLQDRKNSFYEALCSFCSLAPKGKGEEFYEKAAWFLSQLEVWRTRARQGELSELIWHIYRDTLFYDFVGGLPGGKQRQANLRALYDRARQYEETSFRGLFRFLRFIERMRERGEDLGAARALGEGEDVVRLMTIHSSKGLEFPVVFIAGLGRQFNTQDLKKTYMLDKELGFAAKYINAEKRISYPSLPQLAFKKKKKLELLAEEMRILYVALTRAKEKLYLVASGKELEKKIGQWREQLDHENWLLKEYDRISAKGFLDWIGPALIRHKDCGLLRGEASVNPLVPEEITNHPSTWKIELIKGTEIEKMADKKSREKDSRLENVFANKRVDVESEWKREIEKRLSWEYSFERATIFRSKQSVSEVKRQREMMDEESGNDIKRTFSKPILKRPRFMGEKALTPAEQGTAMHVVMQQLDLEKPITEQSIMEQLEGLVEKELLTEEEKEVINVPQIIQFFDTSIGKRMLQAKNLKREVPFSASFPASFVYKDWHGEDEHVLIQGVIDCLFEDEGGLVLLDYKTDRIQGRFKGGIEQAAPILAKRYEVQLDLYTRAVEQILNKKVKEKYLYFFDGGFLVTGTSNVTK